MGGPNEQRPNAIDDRVAESIKSLDAPSDPNGVPVIRRDEERWVELTNDKLDVAAADRFLRDRLAGGIVLFVGTTREWTGERQTELLSYEAHVRMAFREMNVLVDKARGKWPAMRVCLLHRLGRVDVTEASVVVGVACAHRADAYDASRFLIDTLKEDVPIWKKELFADGQSEWVNDPLSE